MRSTTLLRQMLAAPGLVMAPGVAEAMSAKVVAKVGFRAIYMTGSGSSAIRLGMPDTGLMNMVEMVDNAQRIAEASGLPLIADADEGFGGPLNVQRTVRAYERAGIAAIHIEDQQLPKRCGHLAGKTLISNAEMCGKIKAACDARQDADFLLIARTDAVTVEGIDRALERAALYEDAGADMVFVEGPQNTADLARIPKVLKKPALFNMASVGKTPFLAASEIEALGYKLAIYPNFVVLAAMTSALRVLTELKDTGTLAGIAKDAISFQEFFEVLGLNEIQASEARYSAVDKK